MQILPIDPSLRQFYLLKQRTRPMPQRVTLRDIARESGYHFTTVSLALRDHPSIPPTTRKKISAVAQRLDYRPDPVLSALNAYRRGVRRPEYAGTLLWIENHTKDYDWRKISLYRDYFSGAKEYADALGYRLETFKLNETGMTPKRANAILSARRAQALLIPPQVSPHVKLELNWDQLASVRFGYTVEQPRLHLVSNNHFKMMTCLLVELRTRYRYKRPGLVILRKSSERVENKWLGAYLSYTLTELSQTQRIPPLILDQWEDQAFTQWYKKTKPDVIIGGIRQTPELLPFLVEKGIRVPEDVGFADHNLFDDDIDVAGMHPKARDIGKAAVQLLIGMIYRNEVGIPESPRDVLVDGVFYSGPTIKSQ